MAHFVDEVIVFGVGTEECYEALDRYSEELWSNVDDAMTLLWETEEERALAKTLFSSQSLLIGEPRQYEGVVALRLDSEADASAESISSTLGCFAIAIRVNEDKWCELVAFDKGRRLGWLFWVSPNACRMEGEVVPAAVAAALANGGRIGDPSVFEAFLPEGSHVHLVSILGGEWENPTLMAEALKAAFVGLDHVEHVEHAGS